MHLLPHPDLDLMRIGHCYLCGSRPDFTQELRRNRQHPKASLLHIFINKVLRHINPFLEDKYKHRRRIPESEKSHRFPALLGKILELSLLLEGMTLFPTDQPSSARGERTQMLVEGLSSCSEAKTADCCQTAPKRGVSDEIELNNRSSSYDFHEDRDVFLSAWVIHCVATVTFRTARRFPSRNGMCPHSGPSRAAHIVICASLSSLSQRCRVFPVLCWPSARRTHMLCFDAMGTYCGGILHTTRHSRGYPHRNLHSPNNRHDVLRRSMPNAERFANCFCRLPSTSHSVTADLALFVHPVSLSCDLPPKQMTARYLTVAKNERGKEWLKPFGEENTTERGKSIRPQRMCIPSKPSGCNGESQTPKSQPTIRPISKTPQQRVCSQTACGNSAMGGCPSSVDIAQSSGTEAEIQKSRNTRQLSRGRLNKPASVHHTITQHHNLRVEHQNNVPW
ncbi:hypothetical protein BLNAU_17943 [Blattamonas nauphoetae]|uniref:Uncharacterized protein n=1 Tax=Blattamonas nauphoetae TaxID=2049346 RepID=A0ABQ9X5N5_9EUKA|nr:hypothetical protein BLNAU_17943 [Blattamonas nauphoetae]